MLQTELLVHSSTQSTTKSLTRPPCPNSIPLHKTPHPPTSPSNTILLYHPPQYTTIPPTSSQQGHALRVPHANHELHRSVALNAVYILDGFQSTKVELWSPFPCPSASSLMRPATFLRACFVKIWRAGYLFAVVWISGKDTIDSA